MTSNVYLTNTFEVKKCIIGFSWTTFFFGAFVPIIRGNWKWAIIIFLCAWCTFGLSNFIFAFLYNKLYVKDLLMSGYSVMKYENYNKDLLSNYTGLLKITETL